VVVDIGHVRKIWTSLCINGYMSQFLYPQISDAIKNWQSILKVAGFFASQPYNGSTEFLSLLFPPLQNLEGKFYCGIKCYSS